jgi:hypothetical protein
VRHYSIPRFPDPRATAISLSSRGHTRSLATVSNGGPTRPHAPSRTWRTADPSGRNLLVGSRPGTHTIRPLNGDTHLRSVPGQPGGVTPSLGAELNGSPRDLTLLAAPEGAADTSGRSLLVKESAGDTHHPTSHRGRLNGDQPGTHTFAWRFTRGHTPSLSPHHPCLDDTPAGVLKSPGVLNGDTPSTSRTRSWSHGSSQRGHTFSLATELTGGPRDLTLLAATGEQRIQAAATCWSKTP